MRGETQKLAEELRAAAREADGDGPEAVQADKILGPGDEVVADGGGSKETTAPPPKPGDAEPDVEPASVEPPSATDEEDEGLEAMSEGELREELKSQKELTNDLAQRIKELEDIVKKLERIADENSELRRQLEVVNETNEQLQDRIAQLTGQKKAERKEKWGETKKKIKERLGKVKVKEWAEKGWALFKEKVFEPARKFAGLTPSDEGEMQREYLQTIENSHGVEIRDLLEERRKKRSLTDVGELEKLLNAKVIYPFDLTNNEKEVLEEAGISWKKRDWRVTKKEKKRIEKEREARFFKSLSLPKKLWYGTFRFLLESWSPIKVARDEAGAPAARWRDFLHPRELRERIKGRGNALWYLTYGTIAFGGVIAPGIVGVARGTAAGLNAAAGAGLLGSRWAAERWGGKWGKIEEIANKFEEVEKREETRLRWRVAAIAASVASGGMEAVGAGAGAAAAANLAESLGLGEILREKVRMGPKRTEKMVVTSRKAPPEAAPATGQEEDILSVKKVREIETARREAGLTSPAEASGLSVKEPPEVAKLELGDIRIGKEPESDTFWDALGSHLKGKDIGTNWVNPENKVTKTQVLQDFVKDILQKKGAEVDVVRPGDIIRLKRHLSEDELEAIAKIIRTKSVDEYLKLRPEIIGLGQANA